MAVARQAKLIFKNLGKLDEEEIEIIRSIRNEIGVRKNMYSHDEISRSEHLEWVAQVCRSNDTHFYAVLIDGKVAGGASISAIDVVHKRASWAFYLSSSYQGRGIGSVLEQQFVDFLFDNFDIEKLNCEVIEFNGSVIKLHKRFGFIQEGVRRNHVLREGRSYDAVLLGITRQEWNSRSCPHTEK